MGEFDDPRDTVGAPSVTPISRHIAGDGEPFAMMPNSVYDRYLALDPTRSWQLGEDVVRELLGAIDKLSSDERTVVVAGRKTTLPDPHTKPSVPGTSAAEQKQRAEIGEQFVLQPEPEQRGFLPWHEREYDALTYEMAYDAKLDCYWLRERGIEVKHYVRWRNDRPDEVGTERADGGRRGERVGINDRIAKQLIDDHFAKLSGQLEPLWVFSGAPPSEELMDELHRLDIEFVALAPGRRRLVNGGGVNATGRDFVDWLERELRHHRATGGGDHGQP